MADQNAENWRTIRGQRPLNESRITAYTRLMEAEERLAHVRRRRGVSDEVLADLLDAPSDEQDDVYLSTLARYVAALGGHLEVQAVFPEETITLLREPAEGGAG